MMMRNPEDAGLLQVQGFSGGFETGAGFTPILDDVNFALKSSVMTAIVGETGSGKSVMALSMLGLTPSTFKRTSGRVLFDGTDLSTLDERAYRSIRGNDIGMVFQDARAALNPVISIGSQLIDACRAHSDVSKKEARERAEDMLRSVRVPEPGQRMRQFAYEFSGGMAQRVMLALALICEPKLLILDEPTTGLDVTIQADIMELVVDQTRSRGMTACLITHDLGVVAETCENVVVMYRGEVRETGNCAQVLSDPQDAYTQKLLRSSRFEELAA
ncbi:ABC transporter ATP-binding protein [Gordonia sp. DT219]|uniref:ABC transporter ATP-binding protein n=1 Tax=Gordonia sp. DT219 TaxID=3416658 RepID=UPI003CEB543F